MEHAIRDREGNHLVTARESLENDSLRIDISRQMLMQMHHGDAILIQPDPHMGAVMRIVRAEDIYRGY